MTLAMAHRMPTVKIAVPNTKTWGGMPILVTPVVRENLTGTPATITPTGQHNITVPYPGETAARGDYPAAMKAVADKHHVPVVDITAWSKAIVEARRSQRASRSRPRLKVIALRRQRKVIIGPPRSP